MWALPSQYMFCTFRQHSLKAHRSYQSTDFIRINQAGVAEHLRFFAKHLFHFITLAKHFFTEAVFVSQRWQAVWIRFAKELTTAGIIQLVQQVNHRRSMNFKLLQCHTGNRKRHFESSSRVFHHLNQRTESRYIRSFGNLIHTGFICIVIIVIMIGADIEKTVAFQVYNLMYFEIKTDRSHSLYHFIVYHNF